MIPKMKPKASQHKNRFLQIITIPYRALCKARDFYVNSITDCANGNTIGLRGVSQAPNLPRSFSVGSAHSGDSEDFRELVRAASASSISRLDLETKTRAGSGGGLPPRSVSVGMGRIDEDRPCCYFGEDVNGKSADFSKKELKYPRSRSHAVARTSF